MPVEEKLQIPLTEPPVIRTFLFRAAFGLKGRSFIASISITDFFINIEKTADLQI